MPELASPWPIVAGLAVLALLAGNALAWTVLALRLRRRDRRLQRRLGELIRRLSRLELRASEPPAPPVPAAPPEARPRAAGPRANRPHLNPDAAGATLISVPDLGHDGATADGPSGDGLGQRHGAVWALAEAGVAPDEIARRTGQPIGEVELILGLQRSIHPRRGPSIHVRPE
jgi:hypothetical protein